MRHALTSLSSSTLLALLTLGSACDPGPADTLDGLERDELAQRLYVRSTKVWDDPQIPVCWMENVAASDRDLVRETMTGVGSWSYYTGVTFVGWDDCVGDPDGIRIYDSPKMATNVSDFPKVDVFLDFVDPELRWTRCKDNGLGRDECIAVVGMHEFGHALGFAHEHDREDKPAACTADTNEDGNEYADIEIGPWDGQSIMNYCGMATELSETDIAGAIRMYGPRVQFPRGDWDGDDAADLGLARERPDNKIRWFVNTNLYGYSEFSDNFGAVPDLPVHQDYDGDGQIDYAVVRWVGGHLKWYIDWDRDGASERRVWFGAPGDIPVPGDYDGDGNADVAVIRPVSLGYGDVWRWYIDTDLDGSSDIVEEFGFVDSLEPLPADYDGDGHTEIGGVEVSNGNLLWRHLPYPGGYTHSRHFGTEGDRPVPGDYDGDGDVDPAVARPVGSSLKWYADTEGGTQQWWYGAPTDRTIPADYDGDGDTDPAVVRRNSNDWRWYIDTTHDGSSEYSLDWGDVLTDVPL